MTLSNRQCKDLTGFLARKASEFERLSRDGNAFYDGCRVAINLALNEYYRLSANDTRADQETAAEKQHNQQQQFMRAVNSAVRKQGLR
jgi:hypothetical protein